jgi:hemerythrin HHE cation binding domain-containing protein
MREDNMPGSDTAQLRGSAADLGVMLAAHRAFRRDVTTLARAASRDTLRDPVRRVTVGTGWEVFRRQLLLHHQAEDAGVWPVLRTRLAGRADDLAVLDEMAAEHSLIDPLVATVDQALGDERLPLGDVIGELASTLGGHLDHEERDALPLIGATLTDAEWLGLMASLQPAPELSELVPWLVDGLTADDAADVLAMFPPALAQRYRGEWKPWYDAVSRW